MLGRLNLELDGYDEMVARQAMQGGILEYGSDTIYHCVLFFPSNGCTGIPAIERDFPLFDSRITGVGGGEMAFALLGF